MRKFTCFISLNQHIKCYITYKKHFFSLYECNYLKILNIFKKFAECNENFKLRFQYQQRLIKVGHSYQVVRKRNILVNRIILCKFMLINKIRQIFFTFILYSQTEIYKFYLKSPTTSKVTKFLHPPIGVSAFTLIKYHVAINNYAAFGSL